MAGPDRPNKMEEMEEEMEKIRGEGGVGDGAGGRSKDVDKKSG